MIQRIQTVYLLIVTALLIATMCLPVGYFVDSLGEHVFNVQGIGIGNSYQSTWGLLGILVVNTMVSLATILLFKNRMLQIRMTIFNSLLLLGYYIAIVAFYFALSSDMNFFRMGWASCLPFIAIILNLLAIRSIRRDESMVKAADRLR